jgi:replication-associated recombination protein RarA
MDNILGQESIVQYLRSQIDNPPHIILWGQTGIGKTLLANAFIQEHLVHQGVTDPEHQNIMTLRLSSADDRGITAIRQRLTEFVRRRRPVDHALAWVILDDADNLPVVTQQALRRILELYAHQTRFCFVAQSPEHFIEPIQSRCVLLQCLPVILQIHGPAILKESAPTLDIEPAALDMMTSLCMNNARQFTLISKALLTYKNTKITTEDIQLLINAPPVNILLKLQKAIIARDTGVITECVLTMWSKGYSFEDCITYLEIVVRIYNGILTEELQYVLQCCAEGHIFQILNRMTTLDLIAVFNGQASSECLAETVV